MDYRNLTQLLSESADARKYFFSLPSDLQTELHKFGDAVRTSNDLRDAVDALNRGSRYSALGSFPHEYSLY